jgi:hypothetical protein
MYYNLNRKKPQKIQTITNHKIKLQNYKTTKLQNYKTTKLISK